MTTTEPMPALLEAYFADLDRALIGTDPREHAETVQAMREDAAEMLNRYGASEETAQRVIADFGPVEQIAAAATPAPAAPSDPARSWADIWLLVGSIIGLVYFLFPLISVAMLIWAIVRLRRHVGSRALQKGALWVSGLAVFCAAFFFIVRFSSFW
ncbi:hypothetical protein LJ753_10265 [Arthrobacter sp. zg-Y20]|uniref:hypothetical protein n=1 Tax=unclassified Arthrobacter TaxID=235627 RepID=UPI001D1537AC|nr:MULTISPECIES: hypothetical protein [unclassified Arthrobacter]MCC3276253.1 hypothetical protein [Arthrobacter sp. zg-Y20]MDK1316413.1 hypothetical protein [Arthrobacter sp. zg.Y20]WIB06459.1 hypothetical protein QNO06_01570 [Arthrobacter sp. zg-Y20]